MNPRLRRLLLMIVLPLVLVVLGLWYWVHSDRYQDTDNAYVVADQVSVAPQVPGRVVAASKLDDLRTQLTEAQQQIVQIRASLNGNPSLPYDQQATYKQALAARDDAALQLSYATVKAPADGVVTEVDIKPGDVVAAGHPVFALVMSGKRWIEANFKETQLTHVHVGQAVEITVDTYSGRSWHGT